MTAASAKRDWTREARRYLAALAIVFASTVVAELMYRTLDTNRLSPIFLAAVLVVAVRLGSGPAYFAAVLAFSVYNFYLVEPRFTLNFDSAEDVLLLVVFLAVAMLTGGLAGRVRDQAEREKSRAETATALFDATRAFSSSNAARQICAELAARVAQAARGEALMVRHGETFSSDAALADRPDVRAALQAAAGHEARRTLAEGWRVRGWAEPDGSQAALIWRAGEDAEAEADDPLIEVLIEVGAVAIARARLAEAEAEMRAISRTERLRNALLSSISHDLRTPLAAILASAGSLRQFGDKFDASVRSDLLTTIEEEAERLNQFVANLLNMTKLEGGGLAVELSEFDLAEVAERAIRRLEGRCGRRRLVLEAGGDLAARGDPILVEQALGNVLENAVRFTPDGSQVDVAARPVDGMAVVEVADRGPGVAQDELSRIFEKFYRSAASANRPGAGLGLSIVKGLIEAMGGAVSARARPDGGGLVVSLMLPGARP